MKFVEYYVVLCATEGDVCTLAAEGMILICVLEEHRGSRLCERESNAVAVSWVMALSAGHTTVMFISTVHIYSP
jgi:hypothetical protein